MEEHLKGHWGVFKTYRALKSKGSKSTKKMVQEVCDTCEICAQFRNQCPRAPYGRPFFSLDPGHTVFSDVIGPLPRGKGGALYIHCMVDSATGLGDAMQMRDTSTASILRAFQHWIRKNGIFTVLVTDNATYYACEEMASWCEANGVDHKFIAPYRHQSVGLVERYHQTLINRIRKLRFLGRGSWTDYIDKAVDLINEAVHSVTKFLPLELRNGTHEDRVKAHQRLVKEREYRNKRRVYLKAFYPGQVVLAWNEQPGLSQFQPRWRGPYVLTEKISDSLWAARLRQRKRRGRQPILRFHVDQLQPYSLD